MHNFSIAWDSQSCFYVTITFSHLFVNTLKYYYPALWWKLSFTGFDLITQFQLDVIPLKGVRKVDGSTSHQVAYRLDREANFQIPTM